MRYLRLLCSISLSATLACSAPAGAGSDGALVVVPNAPRATAPASIEDDSEANDAYPAGLCGLEPYLASVCGEVPPPRFAVVLDEIFYFTAGAGGGAARFIAVAKPPPEHFFELAERALAAGRALDLAPGFPFMVTYDQMPAADESKRGGAVVAGLFASEAGARRLVARAKLGDAAIVPLADLETVRKRWPHGRPATMAVEITLPTNAYDPADIERLEEALNSQNHRSYAELLERREAGLRKLVPACSLAPGRLFSVEGSVVDEHRRAFAPVQCGTKRAWAPWAATRLDGVVAMQPSGPMFFQVVLVECDVPTLTSRPLSSSASVLPAAVGCAD
jgi:hypothetical protein